MGTGHQIIAVKAGVDFGPDLAPAGARILEVLKSMVDLYPITITSARDGVHSGPTDPHHLGEAFDIRTHGLPDASVSAILDGLRQMLGGRFFAFLEAQGTTNAHIHVQRRKGTVYTMLDYLSNS